MSEEKFSKCEEKNKGGGISVEFRVFGKKKELKGKCRKKNQSVFRVRGLCLTHVGAPCCKTWLKLKLRVLKLRLQRRREKKIKIGDFYWVRTHWLVAMLIEKKFNHMG